MTVRGLVVAASFLRPQPAPSPRKKTYAPAPPVKFTAAARSFGSSSLQLQLPLVVAFAKVALQGERPLGCRRTGTRPSRRTGRSPRRLERRPVVSRAGLSYSVPGEGIVLTKSGHLAWTSLPSRATNAPSTSGSGTIVCSPVLARICSSLTVWMTLHSRLQVSPEPNNRQEATSHPQCRPHGFQL